jgi:hypothetical protein
MSEQIARAPPLCPNKTDIAAHLHALFPPAFVHRCPDDTWIEVAFCRPDESLNKAQPFSAFDLKEAIEFAEEKNRAGYNVYVGAALRHGEQRGRANSANVLTASHSWAEFDNEGDAARIDTVLKEKSLLTAMTIATGHTPHLRAHLYFKLADRATPEELKNANTALKTWLGSDDVQNADRVMRLAGTINYPSTGKIERGYVAELVTLQVAANPRPYHVDTLVNLTKGEANPYLEFGKRVAQGGRSDDELRALLTASQVPHCWHNNMRDAVASMVGKRWPKLAIKATCAPYADGGIADEKLIDSAVAKFGKPEKETIREQPEARASRSLPLDYYNELTDPPPKLWIMKNVLARGETSTWFGPPGVGKSVLMTDLAFHVAWGCDWRGYRSKETCGVVYIALARGALVKRRLSAYMSKYGALDLPIAVASDVIDLKDKTCIKLIVDTVREAEARFGCKVGLIVIDTISKGIAAGGGEEGKAKDVNMVLANLRRVEELTNVHISCIGHTGKDVGRGHRGSNANMGDTDLMVQIAGDGTVKTATVIKISDGVEGPLTHYKIESAQLGTDEDGDAITTAIISDAAAEAEQEATARRGLSNTQRRAMELLTRCINDHGRPPPASNEFPRHVRVVSLEEWHTACERGSLSSAEKKEDRDRAFRRAKDDLQTFHRIACLDGLV